MAHYHLKMDHNVHHGVADASLNTRLQSFDTPNVVEENNPRPHSKALTPHQYTNAHGTVVLWFDSYNRQTTIMHTGPQQCTRDRGPGTTSMHMAPQQCIWDRVNARGNTTLWTGPHQCTWDDGNAHRTTSMHTGRAMHGTT